MARNRLVCPFCDARIVSESLCPNCSQPTPLATIEERIAWERGQWDTRRAASAPPRPPAPPATPPPAAARAATATIAPFAPVEQPKSNGEARVVIVLPEVPHARAPAPVRPRPVPARPRPAPPARPAPPRPLPPSTGALLPAGHALALRPGESITANYEGWTGVRRVSLVLTRYRVFLGERWIPLEEVSEIEPARYSPATVVVGGAIELMRFRFRSAAEYESGVAMLRSEVREARTHGARHDPQIVQEWLDRIDPVWESIVGKLRLRIARSPVAAVCIAGGALLTTVILAILL